MNKSRLLYKFIGILPIPRGLLIAIRDHIYSLRAAQETPYGFKLSGPEEMTNGKFEIEDMPLILNMINACDVFINVGANVGIYCCLAAKSKKPVIAFEPHPVNSRLLLRNLETNGFAQGAEIYPTAVGESNGVLKLFGSGTAASLVDGWAGISSENASLVPVVTMDGILSGRYETSSMVILMDVEGAELSVLKGAVKTLHRAKKPWWVIEINISEHQPAGQKLNPNLLPTFDLIYESGYEVYTLSGSPRKILRTEVEEIARSGKDSIGYHNFVCVEASAAAEALKTMTRSRTDSSSNR